METAAIQKKKKEKKTKKKYEIPESTKDRRENCVYCLNAMRLRQCSKTVTQLKCRQSNHSRKWNFSFFLSSLRNIQRRQRNKTNIKIMHLHLVRNDTEKRFISCENSIQKLKERISIKSDETNTKLAHGMQSRLHVLSPSLFHYSFARLLKTFVFFSIFFTYSAGYFPSSSLQSNGMWLRNIS